MQVSVSSHREPEPLSLDAFERLGLFVLRLEDAPEEAELSVALVDVEEMAHLNEQYRGIQGPTDVLSFGCDDPCPTGGDEPILLGDVIISPDVAIKQAAELGTTIEAELNLLLVHGCLHLLGYDHESDEDAAVMQSREQVVLDAYAAE
ncbi:MAG: rRNA maturation RNase YbeY [Coriobacteriia bacterium]|nr:rRNA maturation RNase YbeY [Coriobacteriia bacterium]MBN2822677.1 rRNA maturation RNase YbeY [Coriobacteriia bacterium]